MYRSKLLPLAILTALCLVGPLSSANAAFTTFGNVTPATNPMTWTDSTEAHIGEASYGSLRIDGGSNLNIFRGFIGCNAGSTGEATVTGPGSNWTNGGLFSVGFYGSGTLSIADGGSVSNGDSAYIGEYAGTKGLATVSGAGSTWTSNGTFWVGYFGVGTLNIINGGSIVNDSFSSFIRSTSGTASTATVDGSGSTWNTAQLFVGIGGGRGVLNIVNGGAVDNQYDGAIAWADGSIGSATVNGIGSKWSMGYLTLGLNDGTGTLTIANGGAVTPSYAAINNLSLMTIDVGNGSSLKVNNGTGTVVNDGKVRIAAGAKPAALATFSPISAGGWGGTGTYQPIGGTWNATSHEFTASAVQPGSSGTAVNIDLASIERVLIGDSQTGWAVGASFAPAAGTMSFTATAIDGTELSSLQSLAGSDKPVRGAWDFAASGGYAPGDPVYLSFDVGSGRTWKDLQVWHYNGSIWTNFNAPDLAYDGQYASFTATSFSGYAVTVPEPGTLVMLLAAALGLSIRVRRKRK